MASTPTEHRAWTSAGSNAAAQATYASVRHALGDLIARRNLDVFLQGSYANSTNIRADSDVDIVVLTRQTFQGSLERLSERRRHDWEQLPAATYSAQELRREVSEALVSYYGAGRVTQKNKCMKVAKRDGYVDADVVPAIEYRWYRGPESLTDYASGIVIHPLSGGRIINFPKQHISNGQTKNGNCAERYKPSVRQMKHLRNRAVDERRLGQEVAPGYLLECLTYNVPTDRFAANDSQRLSDIVLWLKFADKQNFLSCDGIHRLFATDPGGFSVGTAQQIVDALWGAY